MTKMDLHYCTMRQKWGLRIFSKRLLKLVHKYLFMMLHRVLQYCMLPAKTKDMICVHFYYLMINISIFCPKNQAMDAVQPIFLLLVGASRF